MQKTNEKKDALMTTKMSRRGFIGTVGALINWLAAYEIEEHDDKGKIFYFIGGLIAFTIWIVVFVIFRYFTL